MEETRTGGRAAFFFSVVWSVILLCLGQFIISLLPRYKVIGTVITLLMFCVLGFFVLTRYSAIYTYTLKNNRFRINRRIGYRNKEVEIRLTDIRSVTGKKPKNIRARAQNMRSTVFSSRNIWYIVYGSKTDKLVVCEISDKMAKKLGNNGEVLDCYD